MSKNSVMTTPFNDLIYIPVVIPRKLKLMADIIARNLGLPVEVVLGDLVVKALTRRDPDIIEFRLMLSEKFLHEGEKLLKKNDLIEASEKFWVLLSS